MSSEKIRLVALISGRGSNLQAIIDGATSDRIAVDIQAVISNQPDAPGLEKARQTGIAAKALSHRAFPDRAKFDAALRQEIDRFAPDLVILAGFMRILGTDFVNHYLGRLLNIHPSLLPKFPGLDTHARALAAKESWHGASVHFVTPELDGGPVIIQAQLPILPNDTPDTLAARVLEKEHRIYPQAVRWFSEGRLRLVDGKVELDGVILTNPYMIDE